VGASCSVVDVTSLELTKNTILSKLSLLERSFNRLQMPQFAHSMPPLIDY